MTLALESPVRPRSASWWIVGIVVSIALTSTVGIFTTISFRRLTEASQRLGHTNQVLYSIEQLTSRLRDIEILQRGYLATGDPQFLDSYGRSNQVVQQSLARIRQLTADDADQQRRLGQLAPLVGERMRLLAQLVELRQSRDPAAVSADRLGQAGQLMARIDGIASDMIGEETRVYQVRDAAAEQQARIMALVMLVGSLASLAIVGTICALMSREVGRRRQAEEVLRNLNNTLEARMAARTTELRREVAERRKTEERLRSTSIFLDTVIENVPGMIFVKDARDNRFVLLNRGGEELLGRDRDAVVGRTDHEIFPREEARRFVERDRQALAAGRLQVTPEEYLTASDHRVRLLRTTEVPVLDDGGRPQYLVGFSQDITESRAIEQQLRQGLKMEAMGQLTGGVAHDFNNLLGITIANLDLVIETPALPPAVAEASQAALHAALRGAELTKLLLAFSRKRAPEPAVVDLNERLAQIGPMLKQTLSRQIVVELDRQADLWPIMVDPAQTETAVLNIAINARDAMPKGGKLTLTTANVELDKDYAARHVDVAPGDYVLLAIGDTGGGIPPAVLERVFEPFFTTKGKGKGTGLGLAMVYGYVRQAGGHVRIESEVGYGTTVKLYFPRATGAAAAAPEPEATWPQLAGKGELVLVVDDEDGMRSAAIRQLAELGYRTLEADTGPAALAVLEAHPDVELLFSDVIMPGGMNGYELAAATAARWPAVRILLMSGFTAQARPIESELADKLPLLDKPFRKRDLAARLREVLAPRA